MTTDVMELLCYAGIAIMSFSGVAAYAIGIGYDDPLLALFGTGLISGALTIAELVSWAMNSDTSLNVMAISYFTGGILWLSVRIRALTAQ